MVPNPGMDGAGAEMPPIPAPGKRGAGPAPPHASLLTA